MDVPAFNTPPYQTARPELFGKPFGIRAASYVIDTIIALACTYALFFITGYGIALAYNMLGQRYSMQEANFFESFLIGIITTIAYFFMFEWLFSATPGKLILGMRVVKMDGTPCDARAAIVRMLYRYIDSFFFAMPAMSSMKPPLYQRHGDKSANTVVVSRNQMVGSLEWWRFVAAAVLYLLVELGGSIWIMMRQINPTG